MKLEVGEFYLSANGNITKIIECTDCEELQDEYNYKSNDDEWYRHDGNYGENNSEKDLIAHIPKELHYSICSMVEDYHTKKLTKTIVNFNYVVKEDK